MIWNELTISRKEISEIIWRNIVSRIEYASFSSPVAHFG